MRSLKMVPVGKIVRAHGIKGSIKVYPYGDTFRFSKKGDRFFIGTSPPQELTLVKIQPQKNCWILTFREIRDRNTAEELVGKEITLPENLLPELDSNEYYYYQLIGMEVKTKEGEYIGIIKNIIETGANDVYVVEYENKEVLIPALEDVVINVDIENKVMTVDLPEGLME